MAKKEKEKDCKEDEGAVVPPAAAGDGGADHDDAAQDIALIKKMIDEHLGSGSGEEEGKDGAPPPAPPAAPPAPKEGDEAEFGVLDTHKEALQGMTHEAYEAYKEMGMSRDEAMEAAKCAMKLAHHMAMKQAKDGAAGGDAPPPAAPKEKDLDIPNPKAAPGPDKSSPGSKGGLESEIIALKGKIALMEAKQRKQDLMAYVDKKLKESGHEMSVTKAFREAAEDITSPKDFDAKWKIFTANQKPAGLRFVITEKSVGLEEGSGAAGTDLDFNSVVKDDEEN